MLKQFQKKFLLLHLKLASTLSLAKALCIYIIFYSRSLPSSRLTIAKGAAKDILGSPKICIFAAYQSNISSSTKLFLEFISSQGFAIVFVNNSKINDIEQDLLSRICTLYIERINIGRDIGALKDAFVSLNDSGCFVNTREILFTNDSVQFFGGRALPDFAEKLNSFSSSPSEALFTHASYQNGWHFQSFFFLLKRSVFNSDCFISFWKKYMPIDNRRYSIEQGEILLSKKVFSKIRECTVLYTPDKLIGKISRCRSEGLLSEYDIRTLLPSPYRTLASNNYNRNKFLAELFSEPLTTSTIQDFQSVYISYLIEMSNPSHVAAFLYPIFLGCPFVKKDLSFAGTFSSSQVIHNFNLVQSYFSDGSPSYIDKEIGCEYRHIVLKKGIPLAYYSSPYKAHKLGLGSGFVYDLC